MPDQRHKLLAAGRDHLQLPAVLCLHPPTLSQRASTAFGARLVQVSGI